MELGIAINKFADALGSNKGIASILDNPFYTAIMITLIIAIILFFQLREMQGFATYFYMFCVIVATIFVYHRRFDKKARAEHRTSDIASALSVVPSFNNPETISIVPPSYMTMTPAM
jgi:Mn2+/Fe2+ NRAMP family transporter